MIYKHSGVTREIHKKTFDSPLYRLSNINIVTVDDEKLTEIGDNEFLVGYEERRKCVTFFEVYADEKSFANRVTPLEVINLEFEYDEGVHTSIVSQAYSALKDDKVLGGGDILDGV